MISGTMNGKREIKEAEDLLEGLYDDVRKNGVTSEEVERAVKQLTVQLIDGIRSPHGLGQFLGTIVTILGDVGEATQDLEKYFRVTAADVQRVAKQYFNPNNRSVVQMLPESKRPKQKAERPSGKGGKG